MEKDIKKTDVAGNSFEDLEKDEMNEVQGQGDVNEETIMTITIASIVTAASLAVCRK